MGIKKIISVSRNRYGGIDALAELDGHVGEHPYTIERGSDLEAECESGKHGPVAPYVAPVIPYTELRRAAYPEIGMQLDADYKNRQKARMWAGKALKSLQDGDLAMAINHLIEAMQPCDESDEIDGQINSIKRKHPKQEAEE